MKTLPSAAALTLLVSLSLSFMTACSTGGGGSSTSGGGGTTTTPAPAATPTITTISPAKLAAGAPATVLTVTGTNFTATSAVQVGGSLEATTYVSATQLTAAIPANQVASGADLPVIVLNGESSSATGSVVNLEVDNPTPTIASLTPSAFFVGSASRMVAITGSGFVPTSTIQINGVSRSTTFISSTQVNVIFTAADLAVGAPLTLTAVNSAPGGGTSAAASVPVNYPVPAISSLSPAVVIVGTATPTAVTVTGFNFTAATTVNVGNTAHPATLVSSTQLTFVLSVAEQATTTALTITATNPAPGGGTSFGRSLIVSPPTPTPVITAVNPTSFVVGSPDSFLTVTGTDFTSSSVVQWNGTALVTDYYFGSLNATVPSSLLAALGTAMVTVSSPTAATPLSNAVAVSIANPAAPTLTSISPNYGPIGTATTITFTGTGFTSATTVSLNGTTLPVADINSSTGSGSLGGTSTSLTVSLPASALPLPGNYSLAVTTPAPGGGTTASQVFSAYIPLVSNSMIYNPVDGLFYASIPGSVTSQMGNSIVSVDPETGALGTPIFVGSEPDKLALTADGHYLWVGLDGASAVRKVDLVAKTAGLQFSLPLSNSGVSNPQALAALPGATDSVIVAFGNTLAIFDAGVARANTSTNTIYNYEILAIQVDGNRNEVYAAGADAYNTFTYDSNGLTSRTALTGISPASSAQDEIQLLPGKLLTDFGQIYDPEAGTLLGTLYVSGQTVAQGATFADSAANKVFVVDSTAGNIYNGFNQIQVFNLADDTSKGLTIPVNVPSEVYPPFTSIYPTRLTRWGANGLAFHTPFGIYSLQSNSVVDLSSTAADLGVTLTSGGSTATGGNATFTAQITNSGPSNATDVVVTAQPPASGVVVSATSTAGTCSIVGAISCSLGNVASGATATVTLTVLQTTAGTSTVSVQVAGSTTDANTANNSASASATITGSAFSVAPLLTAISPAAIESGAADTTLTVTGTGFNSASTVMMGATALTTTFTSATQLTATVPASSVTTLGWAPVTVSTPAPGGGISAPLPLTIYSLITISANRILYDPYSRQIMASIGSESASITGNSIAAINPDTASVGTPVSIGSQPTSLALSSDGQILYTTLAGSQSVARYNMLTGQPDFTYVIPTYTGIVPRGIDVQPGTENTIALDLGAYVGNAIYDFDPANKTAAIRGQASGVYSGSCISFLDAADLLALDNSASALDDYTVTSSGFQPYSYSQYTQSTLNHFGCFKLSGGRAFANGGGIASTASSPATQVATLAGVTGGFSSSQALAADASLQRAFYPAISPSGSYNGGATDGMTAFDLNTFQPTLTLPLNMPGIEGANSGYALVDIVRWEQDGLAILTSTGHIYLLRGAVIVPGLLSSGASAASLGSASTATLPVGSGNALLTLTGSNFAPGTAVTWNGAYRTTTIIDPTHVTVAIPAADLAAAGTGSLVATNPGAPASNTLSVTVQ